MVIKIDANFGQVNHHPEICNMSIREDGLISKLDTIIKLLSAQKLMRKRILNIEEAAVFTGLSKSYLHKLTSRRMIPCSKPNGKTLFFETRQLEKWLLRNPQPMVEDAIRKAAELNFNRK